MMLKWLPLGQQTSKGGTVMEKDKVVLHPRECEKCHYFNIQSLQYGNECYNCKRYYADMFTLRNETDARKDKKQ
jgi:predicted Zn-ribbon and HTH transcriptional regulator